MKNKENILIIIAMAVVMLLTFQILAKYDSKQEVEEAKQIVEEAKEMEANLVIEVPKAVAYKVSATEEPVAMIDTKIPVETVQEDKEVIAPVEESDIIYIAKTLYGEARGCSKSEQAKVAWVILNRVDDQRFPDTVSAVVQAPNQFVGYSAEHPVTDEQYAIALDVLTRWQAEKNGEYVEREIGSSYLYFTGDGVNNHFREEF